MAKQDRDRSRKDAERNGIRTLRNRVAQRYCRGADHRVARFELCSVRGRAAPTRTGIDPDPDSDPDTDSDNDPTGGEA
ncbi:MAG: hypothetical protein ACOX52_07115 [Verrucomicrobiota bacterium]